MEVTMTLDKRPDVIRRNKTHCTRELTNEIFIFCQKQTLPIHSFSTKCCFCCLWPGILTAAAAQQIYYSKHVIRTHA